MKQHKGIYFDLRLTCSINNLFPDKGFKGVIQIILLQANLTTTKKTTL